VTTIAANRQAYMRAVLGDRDDMLERILRHALLERRCPTIQIDDNAGRILQFLTLVHKPKLVVEIGSLFGYSTVHIARGLPAGGRVVGLEIDKESAATARASIAIAGVSDRAEIVEVDALDYLRTLDDEVVDMVFIDADKKAYPDYLKSVVSKLRRGGLIVADDAFADGPYLDDEDAAQRLGIRKYNQAIGRASGFFSTFVGTETGLMMSIKR